MKVLCIEGGADSEAASVPGLDIFEGEVYTVSREHEFSRNKYGHVQRFPVYELEERPPGYGFAKNRFIPLSSIDEKELVKEREGELVTN